MELKVNKKYNWCFIATLALILFYYSYRYIFQFNSVTTSPTYSDTPYFLKVFKYILLFIFSLFLILFISNKKHLYKMKTGKIFFVLVIVDTLFVFFVCQTINSALLLIFSLLAFIIAYSNETISESKLDKFLGFYLAFMILFEIIQIVLFFSIGRLPALAYHSNSQFYFMAVRFGGPFDDPNGFGIVLCFFIPYVFKKYSGYKKYLLSIILLAFLIITWSLTALATFAVSVLFFEVLTAYKNKKIKRNNIIVATLIFVGLIVVAILEGRYGIVSRLFDLKKTSIDGHLESVDVLKDTSVLSFIGLYPKEVTVETGIIRLINYGGIPLLLLFYFLGFYGVYCSTYLYLKNKRYNHIYLASGFYLFSVLVSMINLPMIDSFLNYGIYSLLLGMTINNYLVFKKNKNIENYIILNCTQN